MNALSTAEAVPAPSSGRAWEKRRQPILPNGVLGMLVFVFTEIMLFAGMISAFAVVRATAPLGWPPLDQPRLPVESTAINTAALIASGVALSIAATFFARDPKRARIPLAIAIALGAAFVLVQGAEWVALLAQGLTMTSGPLGGFFYLIIGCHGLHAIVAIGMLVWSLVALVRERLTSAQFATVRVFWYFVVGIWPVLYQQVYL